jgi:VanZ family protein
MTRADWTSFRVWPALAYSSFILVMGSLPVAPPGAAEVSDKTLHFVAFGIMAVLACRALSQLDPGASRPVLLGRGFGAAVLIGGALELWQSLLPYRSCELLDWIADSLGAGLGVAALALVWALRKPRAAGQ